MKNKLFQLYAYFNSIDQRYMQLAYFVFMLAMLVANSPEDGGSGTIRKY